MPNPRTSAIRMSSPTRRNVRNLNRNLPAIRVTTGNARAVDANSRIVRTTRTRTSGYQSYKNATIRRISANVNGRKTTWTTAQGVRGTSWKNSAMFLDNGFKGNARNYAYGVAGAAVVVGSGFAAYKGAQALTDWRLRRMRGQKKRPQNKANRKTGRRRITLRDSNGRFAGSR